MAWASLKIGASSSRITARACSCSTINEPIIDFGTVGERSQSVYGLQERYGLKRTRSGPKRTRIIISCHTKFRVRSASRSDSSDWSTSLKAARLASPTIAARVSMTGSLPIRLPSFRLRIRRHREKRGRGTSGENSRASDNPDTCRQSLRTRRNPVNYRKRTRPGILRELIR